MTIFEMMKKLEDCGDVSVWKCEDEEILTYHVTIEDFDGFDENWAEIDREYVNPDLIEKFLTSLEEQALSIDGDFYYDYYFKDYIIRIGYSSYDI